MFAVHKGGIYCPIHSGHRPRYKFGVEYSSFPDHCKTVALLHHVLHLAGMRYSQLLFDSNSGAGQHFEQSGMCVGVVLVVVEDPEMSSQVCCRQDSFLSKRVIFR